MYHLFSITDTLLAVKKKKSFSALCPPAWAVEPEPPAPEWPTADGALLAPPPLARWPTEGPAGPCALATISALLRTASQEALLP